MEFDTRYKNRQYFSAQFVMSIPIQSNLKDYERVTSDPHACQWQCLLQNHSKPTSYQHADPPATTTLINRRLRSKICNRKKSRLGYAKYVWTDKDKNQMFATTLSFLKASLNQAGRQTTSLFVVNNPYDRITSANTSSKNLQSWQQALDESTKHARSHPLSRTRNPARTHIHMKNL